MCEYIYNKVKSICNEILNSDIWEYNIYTGEKWEEYWYNTQKNL